MSAANRFIILLPLLGFIGFMQYAGCGEDKDKGVACDPSEMKECSSDEECNYPCQICNPLTGMCMENPDKCIQSQDCSTLNCVMTESGQGYCVSCKRPEFVCRGDTKCEETTGRCKFSGVCQRDKDCEPLYCDVASGNCVECLEDTHCPEGQCCDLSSNVCGTCPLICATDNDCPVGQCCDRQTGRCGECPLGGLNEPCPCEEGLICCIQGETITCGVSEGICYAPCEPDLSCPEGGYCAQFPEGGGVCIPSCDIFVNDCPENTTCLPITQSGFACIQTGSAQEGDFCQTQQGMTTSPCGRGLMCDTESNTCLSICRPGGSPGCTPPKTCVRVEGFNFGLCKE